MLFKILFCLKKLFVLQQNNLFLYMVLIHFPKHTFNNTTNYRNKVGREAREAKTDSLRWGKCAGEDAGKSKAMKSYKRLSFSLLSLPWIFQQFLLHQPHTQRGQAVRGT